MSSSLGDGWDSKTDLQRERERSKREEKGTFSTAKQREGKVGVGEGLRIDEWTTIVDGGMASMGVIRGKRKKKRTLCYEETNIEPDSEEEISLAVTEVIDFLTTR